jgi:hypothetical protein
MRTDSRALVRTMYVIGKTAVIVLFVYRADWCQNILRFKPIFLKRLVIGLLPKTFFRISFIASLFPNIYIYIIQPIYANFIVKSRPFFCHFLPSLLLPYCSLLRATQQCERRNYFVVEVVVTKISSHSLPCIRRLQDRIRCEIFKYLDPVISK